MRGRFRSSQRFIFLSSIRLITAQLIQVETATFIKQAETAYLIAVNLSPLSRAVETETSLTQHKNKNAPVTASCVCVYQQSPFLSHASILL
jgi:hypothetical protein